MKRILIFFISTVVLGSCASNEVANSGDVKQSTIHQKYSISYDESENITWAQATYRFGGSNGTTLILTKPAQVTFNGDSMRLTTNIISGAGYSLAYKKPIENGRECEFVYVDTEGKKHVNKLKFNPVLMGTPPAEVKKGMPLELPLFTQPLQHGESLRITLSDTVRTEEFVVENIPTKGSLVVPANVLQPLNGEVTLNISRVSSIPLQSATETGGGISFVYTLKPRRLTVVE